MTRGLLNWIGGTTIVAGKTDAVVTTQGDTGLLQWVNSGVQYYAAKTAEVPGVGLAVNLFAAITQTGVIIQKEINGDEVKKQDITALGADLVTAVSNAAVTAEEGVAAAVVVTVGEPIVAGIGLALVGYTLYKDLDDALTDSNKKYTESQAKTGKKISATITTNSGSQANVTSTADGIVLIANTNGTQIRTSLSPNDLSISLKTNSGYAENYQSNPDGSSTDTVTDAKGDYSKTSTDYTGNSTNVYKNVNGSYGDSKTLLNGYS
jgi:hypothetical protein